MASTTLIAIGIDLASGRWEDNGSASIQFTADGWVKCGVGVIPWPGGSLTPAALADTIDNYARQTGAAVVCLDGPQGWRTTGITSDDRPGVGRWCEYEVNAQGKTGEYGHTYPRTQAGWIRFCIAVFDELLAKAGVVLVNDADATRLDRLVNGYWLLEVFPTSIWRSSGLPPLPGKARTTLGRMDVARGYLTARYGMPNGILPERGSHDDLQALVAALPGVGLLGGPAVAEANGFPAAEQSARGDVPVHRVEGLIWDARPRHPGPAPDKAAVATKPPLPANGGNPLLPDDRDPHGDAVYTRGVALFRHLAERHAVGEALGIGYADFVAMAYGVEDFAAVAGRPFAQSDIGRTIELADQITHAAGGPVELSLGESSLNAGMDSFIWPKQPPHRLKAKALTEHQRKHGYTAEEWEAVFPEPNRKLILPAQPGLTQ